MSREQQRVVDTQKRRFMTGMIRYDDYGTMESMGW